MDFAIDHKIQKNSWEALRNSPMVTILLWVHFAITLRPCHFFAFQVSLLSHGAVTHSSGFSLKFSFDCTIEKLEVTPPDVNPQSGLLIGNFFAEAKLPLLLTSPHAD